MKQSATEAFRKNCEGITPEDLDYKFRFAPRKARGGRIPCSLKLSPALAGAWLRTAAEVSVAPDELLHVLLEESQEKTAAQEVSEATGMTIAELREIGLRRVLAEFRATGAITETHT